MTLEGVDFSFDRLTAQQLQANGMAFVGRYVAGPNSRKNITAAEVADFTGAGIGIVIFFETTGQAALRGAAGGAADATSADQLVTAVGMAGCPIYFTTDFDVKPNQQATVGAYLGGAAGVIGLDRVGIYGGLAIVTYALDNGLATYACQTKAWSPTVDPRVHLYQYSINNTLVGAAVDHDRTVVSDTDYGQARVTPPGPGSPPAVTGIDPTEGPEGGGTTVVLTGTGFTGATGVGFGDIGSASVNVDSDSQISAVSPGGTGAVDVTVVTPAGTSPTNDAATFTYSSDNLTPQVDRVDPASGPTVGGTSVDVVGSRLTGATTASFGAGNNVAVLQSVADDRITVTSPAGSGSVDVTVTTPAGTSATSPGDTFTYQDVPQVDALDPASGPEDGGTSVTITGSGFTGATEVDFGAATGEGLSVDSDTRITVTSPPGSGSTDVVVVNAAGASAASAGSSFAYESPN